MNNRHENTNLYSNWNELGLNFSGFILIAGAIMILLPYSVFTQDPMMFLYMVILVATGVRLIWLAKLRKDLRVHGKSNLIDNETPELEKRQNMFSAVLIVGGVVLSLSASVFLLSGNQLVALLMVSGLTLSAAGVWLAPTKTSHQTPNNGNHSI